MQAGTQRAKVILPSLHGRGARKNAELGTRNIKTHSHSLVKPWDLSYGSELGIEITHGHIC